MATLMSGSMLGQLIALAAYPLVTRLFSPADFGLFTVFYSYVEVLVILATGKYELAFPLTADDSEARALLRHARQRCAVVSGLLLALIAILIGCNALPGKTRTLGAIALLIPAVVFFTGLARIHSFLFNRYQSYRPIAASSVVSGAVTSGLKIVLGLMSRMLPVLSKLGLPLATVLGQAAANVSYRMQMHRLPVAQQPVPTRETVRKAARKYRNFPLYVLPKDLISSFSANLPFIWLALYFDNAMLGIFSLALTFTFRPVNLVCADMERVLYVRVNNRVTARQPVGRDMLRFLLRVNLVVLPAFLLLFCFAEPLFVWVFGSEWTGCGFYVRWLLPWCYLSFTLFMVTFIPNIFSTQRTEFFFYVVLLLLRIAAMVAGIVRQDFRLAVALYALSGLLVVLALLVWYGRQVYRYDRTVQNRTQ